MVSRVTRSRSGSSTAETSRQSTQLNTISDQIQDSSNEDSNMAHASQPVQSASSNQSDHNSTSHSQPVQSDNQSETSTRRSKRLRASETESKEPEQKESLTESTDASADAESGDSTTNRGTKRQRSARGSRPATKASKSKSKRPVKEEVPDQSVDSDDFDDDDDMDGSVRKSVTSETTAPAAGPLLAPSAFTPEDLHCVICLDFPVGEIYQCNQSHFLCHTCWVKVTDSENTECPTCRTYLNRDKPIRARFAEQILAGLLVDCPLAHLGCTMKVKHSELNVHQQSQCLYRTVQCRYHPLGCNWQGLALDQKPHFKACEVKTWTPKEILKAVNARTEEREKQIRVDRAQTKAYANLCSYLSKRCRDIEFRDVHIETDTLTNERVANTFSACGLHWQLFLDPARDIPASQVRSHPSIRSVLNEQDTSVTANNASTSSTAAQPETLPQCFMHMKLISPIRRKTIVCILILPGPGLGVDFQPAITKVTYTKHALESEPFRVHVPPDRVGELYERDPINLRVGIIECSRGRMRPHFSTQHSASSRARTQQGDSDSESDSSSDDDDLSGTEDDDSDESDELDPYSYEYGIDDDLHHHHHHHHEHDEDDLSLSEDYDEELDESGMPWE